MSSGWIAALGTAALTTFWLIGAYNRLVGLRNGIVALFAPVDEQFRARQLLLREQIDRLGELAPESAALLDALNAALAQADAACAHARIRPGAAGATRSFRLADEILEAARARLPAEALADAQLAELNQRLAASQASLDFTRRRFNEAVLEYNAAVRQFPTGIAAAMFGFGPAGIV
jgi:LemA protein